MRPSRWLLTVFFVSLPTTCLCQEQKNSRGDGAAVDDSTPATRRPENVPAENVQGGLQDWAAMRRASMERACRLLNVDANSVFVSEAAVPTSPSGVGSPMVSQMDDRKSLEFRRERARKVARKLVEVAANPQAIAVLANPGATPMQKVNAGLQLVGQLLSRDGAESASLNDPDRDEILQAQELLTAGADKPKGDFAEDLAAAIEVERLVAERRAALDRLKARHTKTVEIEEAKLEEYRAALHREQLEKQLEKMPQ